MLLWLLSILSVSSANLPESAAPLQFAHLGTCPLQSGALIYDCTVGYRIVGSLDPAADNIVVIPSWFTGESKDWLGLLGPDRVLDPEGLTLIVIDAIGNGTSSSPSNSPLQPHWGFPDFTIGDMVEVQHTLLTQVLGVTHVRAVLGISMGAMQVWQWAASFPDFMDRIVDIAGTPRVSARDMRAAGPPMALQPRGLGQTAGTEDFDAPAAGNGASLGGDDNSPAAREDSARGGEDEAWARNDGASLGDDDDALPAGDGDGARYPLWNWNRYDRLYQLAAMRRHDISPGESLQSVATRIAARTLTVVNRRDTLLLPHTSIELTRAIPGAELLLLDSWCDHFGPVLCDLGITRDTVRRFLRAE